MMYEFPTDALVEKYSWLNVYPETPNGWDDIVTEMCEEINDWLVENHLADEYVVYQIKEKFGGLRWYDNGIIPNEIIDKYEILSEKTCAHCGKPSTHMTTGWILPLCDECDKETTR